MHTTSPDTAAPGWELPILDGPEEAYTCVRRACTDAGFSETDICARFGLSSLVQFKSRREGRPEGVRVGDALEVLTDLFMDLAPVTAAHARGVLGDAAVDALLTLGLVLADPGQDEWLVAIMLMYPTAGVLLISDRTFTRPGEQRDLPADIVYPAVTRNTSTFVRMLLPSPCEAFLEMCAGNGIAALSMAGRVGHSWSLDITERATIVARFNARLNGLHNVSVLQGDLFEPVRGLTFDRIVAHPPYVPAAAQALVYRDGGPDGEFITKRLVEELPQYLRPGGRFYCTCIATDRTNEPLQQRLRSWLGSAADQFDIVVAVTSAEHPSEHYFKSAIHGQVSFSEAEQRHLAFKDMRVEQLVYSSFVIERHPAPRAPATVRIARSDSTTGRELEQYCDWLSRRDDTDVHQQMLAAYPMSDRHAVLRQTHRLTGDKWIAGAFDFESSWPFAATVQCPDDVAQFLAQCDGTRTVQQLITSLRRGGRLKVSVPDRAVLQIVAVCTEAGALHLEDRLRHGR